MKTLTTAGVLLAFLLAGCTMNGPNRGTSSSNMSGNTTSSMRTDPANYHADNFGEPDNTPFQGVYPSR